MRSGLRHMRCCDSTNSRAPSRTPKLLAPFSSARLFRHRGADALDRACGLITIMALTAPDQWTVRSVADEMATQPPAAGPTFPELKFRPIGIRAVVGTRPKVQALALRVEPPR